MEAAPGKTGKSKSCRFHEVLLWLLFVLSVCSYKKNRQLNVAAISGYRTPLGSLTTDDSSGCEYDGKRERRLKKGKFRFTTPEEVRKALMEEQVKLQELPEQSMYRYFREKVLKKCFDLLRAQEEDEINTEIPLHSLMASMQIVPPYETEEMRMRMDREKADVDEQYRRNQKNIIGQYRRLKYFSSEGDIGFYDTFPRGGRGDPRPLMNLTFYNYTERRDLTHEGLNERAMKGDGETAQLFMFDNFTKNDEVIAHWDKIKLDWAAAGGKGFYPVNPHTMDQSYYNRLNRIRAAALQRMAQESSNSSSKKPNQISSARSLADPT